FSAEGREPRRLLLWGPDGRGAGCVSSGGVRGGSFWRERRGLFLVWPAGGGVGSGADFLSRQRGVTCCSVPPSSPRRRAGGEGLGVRGVGTVRALAPHPQPLSPAYRGEEGQNRTLTTSMCMRGIYEPRPSGSAPGRSRLDDRSGFVRM